MYYEIASVDSIIIYFSKEIDKQTSNDILNFYQKVKSSSFNGIIELIPSFTTLYIQFDIYKYTHDKLFEVIKPFYIQNLPSLQSKEIKTIPTYYGKEVGLDLEQISIKTNLSIDEIISLHSSKIYTVYTLGFSAGFGYMGSIDKKIQLPRLETFREKVPKGSVAIANEQCAVYPQQSPGGWNIIGKTPLELFDKSIKNFSYLQVGDQVKFKPIKKEIFLELGGEL